jgi:MATE family multidrug resistance protein
VLPLAQTLLFIAILQQFVDCAQNTGVCLLRGLGDTRSGFRFTLIGYWVVGLPIALGCAYLLGMQGPGVWLGLCVGLAVTALLSYRRFNKALRSPPDPGKHTEHTLRCLSNPGFSVPAAIQSTKETVR